MTDPAERSMTEVEQEIELEESPDEAEGSEGVETTSPARKRTRGKKRGFVSGFVSILGRPNAGKSTLLNAIVGTKVAIVANKPQTTRTSIQGVLTRPEGQIIFLDTPGIHKSDTRINKRMMEVVRAALVERDLLLFVADCTRPFGRNDAEALSLVRKAETPAFLLLNKIDRMRDKRELLPLIEAYNKAFQFAEIFPISAKSGDGLEAVVSAVFRKLPKGPPYFPEDHLTDQPERFLASELIREKALMTTEQEVPHAVAVVIDKWEESEKLTRIYATIFVERDGQKAILIGSRGAMMKKIGTEARVDMEQVLGRKFFLDLHVKVKANWRENPAFLNSIDWRTMAGANET